ncbi:hypothetical protein ACFP67_12090 [Mammaliicoccus sciuri]|uniref:hypothetical protein n=1 Tax=Mammaliicoccus sciuri TaxID=1296 RepID=UPI000CD17B07|nr:hypothetical protein [Mammaliicoccus sciuri]MEB7065880.1 hypothetical protein [Mammaliicoccus sciuri]PNZ26583.1 hypothetical protein CD114_07595 [Mammaliicoccus sciuri]
MNNIDNEIKNNSIKSLYSTFKKLEKAYIKMNNEEKNTTVVKKRRNSIKIGLDSLQNDWENQGFNYSQKDIVLAIEVLYSLKPSIQKQIDKVDGFSSQKTLNERRLKAINLSIKSLEKRR